MKMSDLTPAQQDEAIAYWLKIRPVSDAWNGQQLAEAATDQALAVKESAKALADDTQKMRETSIMLARFQAAVTIFTDLTSGIDNFDRQRAIARTSVSHAKFLYDEMLK